MSEQASCVTPVARHQASYQAGLPVSPAAGLPGPPGDGALPGEFALRDGTPALIWPLLPADAGTLRDIFRRLSPGSRRHRFLQAIDRLDDPMIERLVGSVDGTRHVALLLTVFPPGGTEEPVGVAHLWQDRQEQATADIAVTVVDDWQRRGAGTALAAALLARRPAAVTRLRTLVASDNRASLALLAKAGHRVAGPPEWGVREVTVDLPAAGQPRRAVEKLAAWWKRSAQDLVGQAAVVPRLTLGGLMPAVEWYAEAVQRIAAVNRDLAVTWAAAFRPGPGGNQAPCPGPSRRAGRARTAAAGPGYPGHRGHPGRRPGPGRPRARRPGRPASR